MTKPPQRDGLFRAVGFVSTLHRFVFLIGVLTSIPTAQAANGGVGISAISVPGGPGSVQGLGESFQPNFNTGVGQYSVAIAVPKGTGGMTPSLALHYNGGDGNGIAGLGWSIGAPAIQRKTDKGIPRYVDGPNGMDDNRDGTIDEPSEIDVFIEPSGEDLIPVREGAFTNFFCKIEGSFTRYRRTNGYWEGTQPDGTRMIFGRTEEARLQNPENPTQTFQWLLEQEIDTHGNTLEYHYTIFPGAQNRNEKFLSEIRYGPGPSPWNNFHFVVFEYDDRLDWFEDCRAGFPVCSGMRLSKIVVGTQGPTLDGHARGDYNHDGNPDHLDRIYALAYHTNSYRTLLRSVTEIGADGLSALPSTTYQYTTASIQNPLSAVGRAIGSENEPPATFENPFVDLVDLNGDGLPDLLRTSANGGGHTGFINQGQHGASPGKLRWSGGQPVTAGGDGRAWNADLSDRQTLLADVDGDGLADLVQSTGDSVYYYRNSPQLNGSSLSWGNREGLAVQDFPPPAPNEDPDARTADVDFDKRMDVIKSIPVGEGVAYQVWLNLGNQKFSHRLTITSPKGYLLSDSNVEVADFNGDRVPDVTRIRPTGVLVTAGVGYGRFLAEVAIPLPDVETLNGDQLSHARLEDINGDGLADLLVDGAEPGTLWFWENRGNYSFEKKRAITGLPAAVGTVQIRWADLNGNGTTDRVVADDGSNPHLHILDIGELLGCVPRPHLLTEIRNGLGQVTRLEYQTSTYYLLRDGTDADGNYHFNWPSPLPFPIEVVSRQIVEDSLGHQYETRFDYHDGYYDPVEKQFRGFERVEQIEIGDVTAPTLVTRSYFDAGRAQEAMKGKQLRETTLQVDSSMFGDEQTRWEVRLLKSGLDGRTVTCAFPVGHTNIIRELGHGTIRRVESEMAYDDFGNQTLDADYGIVENGDRTAFDDERITTTEYAVNTEAWIVNNPARHEIKDRNGVVFSRTESFYDDETFSGGNWGQVTRGDLTLEREWINPSIQAAFVASARHQYDAYGNVVALLDPLASAPGGVVDVSKGHVHAILYDDRFHTYPIAETVHIGNGSEPLAFRAAYDEGFGTVNRTTDFNSHQTTYAYDSFARLVGIVRPGDTPAYPTVEFEYALGVRSGATGLVNYVESRMLDRLPPSSDTSAKRSSYFITRHYVDGLGRALMTKTEAEPAIAGGPPRVAVEGALRFNARSAPLLTLNPFFSSVASTNLEDLLAFESIETPGWTGAFEEDGSLRTLSLTDAHQTRVRYDATLRVLQVENSDGSVTRNEYEPLLERAFDENDSDPSSLHFGTPTQQVHDGLGRQIRVDHLVRINDDGSPSEALTTWSTSFHYDVNDQLTRVIDPQGNVILREYDGLERKTLENEPNRGVTHFEYDEASNLSATVDAKGQRITYTYDGANRVLTEDFLDGRGHTPDVSYVYDSAADAIPIDQKASVGAENTLGQLSWIMDLSGEEHFSYDERGRALWNVKRVRDPESASLVSYKTEYRHDSLDRVTELIYPDQDHLSFLYNERLLLRAMSGGLLSQVDYTPSGEERGTHWGNGVATHSAYDRRERLLGLRTLGAGASRGQELLHYRYRFDPGGNILGIEDHRPTAQVPVGKDRTSRHNTQFFAYDDADRLTQYTLSDLSDPNGVLARISHRYDRIGNMTFQSSPTPGAAGHIDHDQNRRSVVNVGAMHSGGTAGTSGRIGRAAGDPPGAGALTSTGDGRLLSYDDNGNVTILDGETLEWDFKDRLVSLENDRFRARYTYDHSDRRILKHVTSKHPTASGPDHSFTLYVNEGFEIRDFETPTKFAFAGAQRIARFSRKLDPSTETIQFLRIRQGWNAVALNVEPAGPSAAEIFGLDDATDSLFGYDSGTSGYRAMVPGDVVRGGIPYFLRAGSSRAVAVRGPPVASAPIQVVPGLQPLVWPGARGLRPQSDLVTVQTGIRALWSLHSTLEETAPWGMSYWNQDPGATRALVKFPPGTVTFLDATQEFLIAPQIENAGSVRFYHLDHLGSPEAVTGADGSLIEETSYYPYGAIRIHTLHGQESGAESDYTFTGKELDEESELYYFGARYFDASLARWLSVDPLFHLEAGVSSYTYGRNNPLAYVDVTHFFDIVFSSDLRS